MRTIKRDCYVQFQTRSSSVDADYNVPAAGAWTVERARWVEIRNKGGRERNAGGAKESTAKRTIVGDFLDLDGVDAAMRIVWDPQGTFDDGTGDRYAYFKIEAVNPDRVTRDVTVIDALETDKNAAA
jgi:head-tail adaptor